MKQFTSRLPCLTFTHSRCRGDFSSRALAQSWAGTLANAITVAALSIIDNFIASSPVLVVFSCSRSKSCARCGLNPRFTRLTQLPVLLRRESHHDVEPGRQFLDSRALHRREIDDHRRASFGIRNSFQHPVALILRLPLY